VLNDTAEYALRAVLYLARREEEAPVAAAHVAEELGLPRNYLSKILRRLARRGVLESSRGPSGGFRLARPASELALSDALEPFYDLGVDDQCLLGRRRCSEEDPCVAHERWSGMIGDFRSFFQETTVGELVRAEREAELGGAAARDEGRPGRPA